jgi:hypothetical protein
VTTRRRTDTARAARAGRRGGRRGLRRTDTVPAAPASGAARRRARRFSEIPMVAVQNSGPRPVFRSTARRPQFRLEIALTARTIVGWWSGLVTVRHEFRRSPGLRETPPDPQPGMYFDSTATIGRPEFAAAPHAARVNSLRRPSHEIWPRPSAQTVLCGRAWPTRQNPSSARERRTSTAERERERLRSWLVEGDRDDGPFHLG